MYFETEWINGILHFRTTPDGEWQTATVEMLNDRLYAAELELEAANDRIERLEEARNII